MSLQGPKIVPSQILTGKLGEPFNGSVALQGEISRPTHSWSFTGTLPRGLTYYNLPNIAGTPWVKGTFTLFFKCRDNETGLESPVEPVFIEITQGKPIIATGQTAFGTVGTQFSRKFGGTGCVTCNSSYQPGIDAYIAQNDRPITGWAAAGLPSWATFNTATSEITGTPTAKGTTTITLTATGPGGASEATTATIVIGERFSGKVGVASSFTPDYTRTIGARIVSGLPPGLSIDPVSGLISGTPTQADSFNAYLSYGPLGIDAGAYATFILRADRTVAVQSANWGSYYASVGEEWITPLTDLVAVRQFENSVSINGRVSLALFGIASNGTVKYYNESLTQVTNNPLVSAGVSKTLGEGIIDGLSNVVDIATAQMPANNTQGAYSIALKSNGTVVPIILQASSYIVSTTLQLPDLSDVVSIAAGALGSVSESTHYLALKSNGTVQAWGRNDLGQALVPSGLSGVVAIAARFGYSLALKSDGTVVGWGSGGPSKPAGAVQSAFSWTLTGQNVTAIAAGLTHAIALKADGTVISWGSNDGGAIVPSELSGVIKIAAGAHHSSVIKSDGRLVSWGRWRTEAVGSSRNFGLTYPELSKDVETIEVPIAFTIAPESNPVIMESQIGSEASFIGTLFGFEKIAPTFAGASDCVASLVGVSMVAEFAGTGGFKLKSAAVVLLSGLSKVYSGYGSAVSVYTIPTGLQDFVVVRYNGSTTLPVAAGTYQVEAVLDTAEYSGVASGEMVIQKAPQSIKWQDIYGGTYALQDHLLGDAPFPLFASVSSGLGISYTSSDLQMATVAGNMVTLRGAGQVTLTAYQQGNSNYLAATPVSRSLLILAVRPVISNSQGLVVLGVGQQYFFQFQASNRPIEWVLTPNSILPPGFLFDSYAGTLSGAGVVPGMWRVGVIARNSAGDSEPNEFTFGVFESQSVDVVKNVTVNTNSWDVAFPDPFAGVGGVGAAVGQLRYGDEVTLKIAFGGGVTTPPLVSARFSLKGLDSEPDFLVTGPQDFKKITTYTSNGYVDEAFITVSLKNNALLAFLSDFESDAGTHASCIGEFEFVFRRSPKLGGGFDSISTRPFVLRVTRGLV